jgi:predicted metal-dependent hydrolase
MKTSHLITSGLIEANGTSIEGKVYVESRRGTRMSITGKAAHLRLPSNMSKKEIDSHIQTFTQWVKGHLSQNKKLQSLHQKRQYETGQSYQVMGKTFILDVKHRLGKDYSARFRQGIIYLEVGEDVDSLEGQKMVQSLISKVIGKACYSEFCRRVHELNHLYFRKDIGDIRFKYNHSNWGSCSSKKNLNFSTRLLLAPEDVIDYVIIHELSHLTEMNHSIRFWSLVAQAMPEYKEKERWLKVNGAKCEF